MRKVSALISMAIVSALALCLVACGGNQSQSASSASVGSDTSSKSGLNGAKEPLADKNSQFGKVIELEDFDIEFTEAYLEEPRDTGSWYYCDHVGLGVEDDSWVLAVRAKMTSKADVPFSVRATSHTGKAVVNGRYKYEVDAVGANGQDTVDPMATKEIIFFASIPTKMKEQLETADIHWNVSFKPGKNGQLVYGGDQNRNVVNLSLAKA